MRKANNGNDSAIATQANAALDVVQRLCGPFHETEVRWRVLRSGIGDGGEPWAVVSPYVDARALQARLDAVLGPLGWRATYRDAGGGRLTCRLEIFIGGWHHREDGAGTPTMSNDQEGDSGKASYTGSFRRCCAAWGIARNLYLVGDVFAECTRRKPHHSRSWTYAKFGRERAPGWWRVRDDAFAAIPAPAGHSDGVVRDTDEDPLDPRAELEMILARSRGCRDAAEAAAVLVLVSGGDVRSIDEARGDASITKDVLGKLKTRRRRFRSWSNLTKAAIAHVEALG